MKIVLNKDAKEEEPIRIFSPKNPYSKKTKYSLITIIISPILFFILLLVVNNVFYSPELNTFILLALLSNILLSSIFFGYYAGRYYRQADHKLGISLLLFITINPFIWFGVVLSKIVPTIISHSKNH